MISLMSIVFLYFSRYTVHTLPTTWVPLPYLPWYIVCMYHYYLFILFYFVCISLLYIIITLVESLVDSIKWTNIKVWRPSNPYFLITASMNLSYLNVFTDFIFRSSFSLSNVSILFIESFVKRNKEKHCDIFLTSEGLRQS